MRPFGHVVDGAAGCAFTRHQRRRTFQNFDLLEIGRVHDARCHFRRADLDAVVKRVDLGAAEAAHGEGRGRARGVSGRHPDSGLGGLGGGVKPAIRERALINDLDGRRRLAGGQAEIADASGDGFGVERRLGGAAGCRKGCRCRNRCRRTNACRRTNGCRRRYRCRLCGRRPLPPWPSRRQRGDIDRPQLLGALAGLRCRLGGTRADGSE